MAIEVRTNYFKLFTGKPRPVEPNPQLPIVLSRALANGGEIDIHQIRIMDGTRILKGSAKKPFSQTSIDELHVYGIEIFSEEAINTNSLETKRDLLGRKRTFTFKS